MTPTPALPLLDELDELRAKATPGPWATDGALVLPGYWGDTPPVLARTNDYPDAALIVAAVNRLPELIAAARERDALREAVEGLAVKYDTPIADGPCAGQRALYGGGDLAYRLRSVLAAALEAS